MRLKKLKDKLMNNGFNSLKEIKKNLFIKEKNINELKIIGVTGSKGKTSTCVLIHKYLKMLGYKSILYSSSTVDSPLSFIKEGEPHDVPIKDENVLLNIINEAENYGADFLVLEVNDSTLNKGILKDVDFDIRVLTNLNPKHNLEQYDEEEYVNLKKSFFTNINEKCKCIYGVQYYDKALLNELLSLNPNEKYLFSNEYIANARGIDKKMFSSILVEQQNDLNGLVLGVLLNNKKYEFQTKLLMTYNAMNIVCALTVINVLGLLDIDKFYQFIYHVTIPGRSISYKLNERLIIVDLHLDETLECLKELKEKNLINNIIVVTGSIGKNFSTWNDTFKTKRYFDSIAPARKYAMDVLNEYADYVYLTENDNASEKVKDICTELKQYLKDDIRSVIICNREKAIKKAILESKPKDAIFITGRGNKRIMCTTKDTIKFVKDTDVIEELLKELKDNK